jgi:hypothetical protein
MQNLCRKKTNNSKHPTKQQQNFSNAPQHQTKSITFLETNKQQTTQQMQNFYKEKPTKQAEQNKRNAKFVFLFFFFN